MKEILTYLEDYPVVWDYLPETLTECKTVPRQWLINICFSILGDQFALWIHNQIVARNNRVATKGNMFIEMDAEVAEAF